MTFDNPNYPNVTYRYTVKETLFDNNTDRSVTIDDDGKGTARIRFNDYGKYTVTAEAFYGNKSTTFVFGYTHLYRPEPDIESFFVASAGEYTPDYQLTDTLDSNHISQWRRMRIKFDKGATMPHRIACIVNDDTRMQRTKGTAALDYMITDIKATHHVRLHAGDQSSYYLPVYPEYLCPDPANNYTTNIYVYPYATSYYIESEYCGLLSK